MNSNQRIARSSTDRMLGGVCGGVARYLGVDSTLVRLGFVLLTLSGVSPLIYGILWVVMPSDTAVAANWQQQLQQSVGEMQQQATVAVKTVSDQVQKIVGNNDQPPTDGSGTPPATGPTTRL